MIRPLLTMMALAASGVGAQTSLPGPPPPLPNPHVLTLDYDENQVVPLQGKPGYQVTVEFGGDERVQNVAVGDSAAWQVTSNKRGDHLFVKPTQNGVSTNMVVVTDRRLYTFDLSPYFGPAEQMVYAVRFRYPPPAGGTLAPMGTTAGYYRLSGDKAIRPSAISDDGVHTYMQWPGNVTLPAVYVLDADGHETVANGAMREGTYVVDSIAARIVFRRDRHVAQARRIVPDQRR